MDKKDQILDLYFNKHLQQTEISKQLDVSQQYISKIVKKDERYKQEKDYRKLKNAEKRKIYQMEYQKNYVRRKDNDIAFEALQAQLAQDAKLLSYKAHNLSTYALKKANSSIYEYDKNRNQYVMLKGIKASIDLPRRIKASIY
ncbi:MAG: hypothetical protein ILA02_03020 [Clostridia bacterium]|nr:hypothetical protein [Clostridia bacterium]